MNYVWHRSYPDGVPRKLDLRKYASIPDALGQAIKRWPESIAFEEGGETLSYRQLDQHAQHLAAWTLEHHGLQPGDRVAVMIPNGLAYPIAVLALLRAGLVVVNINPQFTARELEYQLRDSGARAIIISAPLLAVMATVLDRCDVNRIVTVPAPGQSAFSELPAAARCRSFAQALAEGATLSFKAPIISASSMAFLQYTGGTTGPCKGAILSHGNIVANLLQIDAWMGRTLQRNRECVLTALPLFHIFALTFNLLYSVMLGARNVLVANPRDLNGLALLMKSVRFTAISGVNTLYNGLLATPAFADADLGGLKLALGGGSAIQSSVARQWRERSGIPIVEGYGLSETSPALCINALPAQEFSGSVGYPLPMTRVTLRDDFNREVPIGEVGELCASGPQVMAGYWQRPDETVEAFTSDGFLRTGDIARMDDHGRFFIVDRKKDMVLVSGFNVYPTEIEAVCAEHPGVHEAACIGVPDLRSGEAVKIYVVRADPALEAEELVRHCREQLTPYKVPRHVAFVDELPKSTVGKILRRELRDAPL